MASFTKFDFQNERSLLEIHSKDGKRVLKFSGDSDKNSQITVRKNCYVARFITSFEVNEIGKIETTVSHVAFRCETNNDGNWFEFSLLLSCCNGTYLFYRAEVKSGYGVTQDLSRMTLLKSLNDDYAIKLFCLDHDMSACEISFMNNGSLFNRKDDSVGATVEYPVKWRVKRNNILEDSIQGAFCPPDGSGSCIRLFGKDYRIKKIFWKTVSLNVLKKATMSAQLLLSVKEDASQEVFFDMLFRVNGDGSPIVTTFLEEYVMVYLIPFYCPKVPFYYPELRQHEERSMIKEESNAEKDFNTQESKTEKCSLGGSIVGEFHKILANCSDSPFTEDQLLKLRQLIQLYQITK
jgi:hypothetical protein